MYSIKNINGAIEIIKQIVVNPIYKTKIQDHDCKLHLEWNNKGYSFSMKLDGGTSKFLQKFNLGEVLLSNNKISLDVKNLYLTQHTMDVEAKGIVGRINWGQVDHENNHYHRMLVPIPKELNLIFSFDTFPAVYKGHVEHFTRSLRVNLMDGELVLYNWKLSSNDTDGLNSIYLVIDSLSSQKLNTFIEAADALLIAVGFISGDFAQNQGYFVQYSDEDFNNLKGIIHSQFRDSIKSDYPVTYSNPHGLIMDSKIATSIVPKTPTVTSECLTKICQNIASTTEYKLCVLLILESYKTSLISKPALLSVALETLTSVISSNPGTSLKPISDDDLSKAVIDKLKKTLSNYSDQIPDESIDVLVKKIDNINQPTNRDKLVQPLIQLGLIITEEDKNAIAQRNQFLHGRLPVFGSKFNSSDKDQAILEYYLYLKILVLLHKFILKHNGFEGDIPNYTKIYEKDTLVETKEPYYFSI